MRYDLQAIETPDFLRLELSGQMDDEIGREIIDKVAAAVADSKHHRVLIDVRKLALDTSVEKDFEHGTYVAQALFGERHRIAQLTTEENLVADEFFETVAANRGLNSRTFTDESAAIVWLIEDV